MENNNNSDQAFAGMVAAANGVAANVGNKTQMERAQKYNLETMAKQQEYYEKNYERAKNDAYEREDFLNRNAKRIEVEALRNAGLNPAWNESSGIVSQSIGSANGSSPTPSYMSTENSAVVGMNAFLNTAMQAKQMQFMDSQMEMQTAQAEKLRASAQKDLADTTKVDLESNFLRSTQDIAIDFTNSEHRKQIAINEYMKDNPDTYEAVATAQKVINDNYKKGMQKIDGEMRVFRAQISKMSKEEALMQQQTILTEIQQMFTTEQIDVLKDKNFRDNISNPNWLLNEMNSIVDDPTIDGETAKAKLTIYGKAYDEISTKQHQLRDQAYGMKQHEDRMSLGYAGLAVHGASGVMEELNWTIERNDRNRWKRADYDQKDTHHNDHMQEKYDARRERQQNRQNKAIRHTYGRR